MPIFSGQIGNFPERDPLAGKKESPADLVGGQERSRGETREYPAYLARSVAVAWNRADRFLTAETEGRLFRDSRRVRRVNED